MTIRLTPRWAVVLLPVVALELVGLLGDVCTEVSIWLAEWAGKEQK